MDITVTHRRSLFAFLIILLALSLIDGNARTIEESIYISVNTPTLNRNIGKYNLHIYG